MTARDINNKVIREADWVFKDNKIYQINHIQKDGTLEVCFEYIFNTERVIKLEDILFLYPFTTEKIKEPDAYSIEDYE